MHNASPSKLIATLQSIEHERLPQQMMNLWYLNVQQTKEITYISSSYMQNVTRQSVQTFFCC